MSSAFSLASRANSSFSRSRGGPALALDVDVIAPPRGEGDALPGMEDGEGFLSDLQNDVSDRLDDEGRKPSGRLIHQHQLGVGRERPRDGGRPLLFSPLS